MKHKLLCCTAFMCGIFTFPFASALEYHYSADLYPNHFYAPTSSNRALDIDSADNSGGAAIIVPSAGMGTDADSTAPRRRVISRGGAFLPFMPDLKSDKFVSFPIDSPGLV